MVTAQCLHIKTNGTGCGSPALRGRDWCYFHANLHGCHRAIRRLPSGSAPTHLCNLPPLEDRESIQLSISAVFASLAAGQIDARQAHALFYGLQLAAANVQHTNLTPWASRPVYLNFHTTHDGIHLAESSRNPEPAPQPVQDTPPIREPDPVLTPEPLPTLTANHDSASASAPDPAPCRIPAAPRLIRSSVTDRLKVRAPYNFRDEAILNR